MMEIIFVPMYMGPTIFESSFLMFIKMAGLGYIEWEVGKNRIEMLLGLIWFMEDRSFCYCANVNGFYLWISGQLVKGKLFRAEVTD